jgi:hypothetical protein
MTAADIARDLCGVIDDVPVVFAYGGVEYQGTRGGLISRKQVVDGGIFEAPELSITTCRKKVNSSGALVDRFSSEPGLQNVITDVGGVSGTNYRIVRVHEDEWGMGVQWDLESVNK